MSVIHGYIYHTPKVEPYTFQRKGFFYRHKLKLAIIISIVFHVSYLSWSFYQWLFSSFTNMSMVDAAYNDIKWIELNKLTKPLKYPANMLVFPGKVVPLDKIKEEIEKAEKAEKARKEEARRKAEERKKKAQEAKNKKDKEDKEKQDDKPDQDDQADGLAKNEVKNLDKDPPPVTPPKFGQINARPIKEIMGKVYNIYRSGNLDIQKAFFSVTVGYEVDKTGSLYEVRIVKSSGSQQLDGAAINIANAISESHALMPLTVLTANTATLELGEDKASFIIKGFATNSAVASDMANLFNQQVAGLRLILSFKNPEALELFSHLQVTTQGNQLIADMTMSRAEADQMMHRNFKSLPNTEVPEPTTTPLPTKDSSGNEKQDNPSQN